jgi:hypothetical protein
MLEKSMEFDPGAAVEAHRSLMATLNHKFWEVGQPGVHQLAAGRPPPAA